MIQSTIFYKDKILFLQQSELINKLDLFEIDKIYLTETEIDELNKQIDEIENQNKTNYYNLFRTNKRNPDRTYTDDVIFSKGECFEWLETNASTISYKNCYWETPEQEEQYKQIAFNKLNEFWGKYPNGVICFC